jgi:hypothetical protein
MGLVKSSQVWTKAVLCAVDDTIEPSRPNNSSGSMVIVDGGGALHHCRSLENVVNVVKDAMTSPIKVSKLNPGDTVQLVASQAQRFG